jgi:hypothetical protein
MEDSENFTNEIIIGISMLKKESIEYEMKIEHQYNYENTILNFLRVTNNNNNKKDNNKKEKIYLK